jgi:hypothetical protein
VRVLPYHIDLQTFSGAVVTLMSITVARKDRNELDEQCRQIEERQKVLFYEKRELARLEK